MPDRSVVLAVDDDVSARESVAAVLPREYQFIGLPDGREFMETVEAFEPDLIILDLHLPGEDGFTLSRRLRSRVEFRHIPVLFLTALREEATWRRLLESQGHAYLTKPFEPRSLRDTIVRLVKGG
jgi:DNA-binding response OmpR family regulator